MAVSIDAQEVANVDVIQEIAAFAVASLGGQIVVVLLARNRRRTVVSAPSSSIQEATVSALQKLAQPMVMWPPLNYRADAQRVVEHFWPEPVERVGTEDEVITRLTTLGQIDWVRVGLHYQANDGQLKLWVSQNDGPAVLIMDDRCYVGDYADAICSLLLLGE